MFSWIFSSHKNHSLSWYVAAGVLILSLIVYSIFEWLYVMSITLFLLAWVYILIENNSSPTTSVNVDNSGIHVWSTFYSYTSLRAFSIVYIETQAVYLRLIPEKKLSTMIDIPLTYEVDVIELKNFLLTQLTEEKDAKFTNSDALIHVMRL